MHDTLHIRSNWFQFLSHKLQFDLHETHKSLLTGCRRLGFYHKILHLRCAWSNYVELQSIPVCYVNSVQQFVDVNAEVLTNCCHKYLYVIGIHTLTGIRNVTLQCMPSLAIANNGRRKAHHWCKPTSHEAIHLSPVTGVVHRHTYHCCIRRSFIDSCLTSAVQEAQAWW